MKKKVSIIICVILAATVIVGCAGANYAASPAESEQWAAGNDSYDYYAMPAPEAPMAAPVPISEVIWDDDISYAADDAMRLQSSTPREVSEEGGAGIIANAPPQDGLAEKIIYSMYADVETMEFDKSIEAIHALMARYGGFIENSSVSGINYAAKFYGWHNFRSAFFSIRVPVENLNTMAGQLSTIGNVVHENSSATNITSQFYDTQSRLNSLQIQEERLLDMLSKADEVPDLIMIEERLSDVRYQIESITTMLNNWQNQVSYSTLSVNIMEVEQFTERQEINRSYWQQIADGFMSSIRGIGRFFMDLFKWIIVSAPVLIIIAVVAVAALFIIRWKLKDIKNKKKAKTEENEQE